VVEDAQTVWSEFDVCSANPWEGYCKRPCGCSCERADAKQYALIQIGKASAMLATSQKETQHA